MIPGSGSGPVLGSGSGGLAACSGLGLPRPRFGSRVRAPGSGPGSQLSSSASGSQLLYSQLRAPSSELPREDPLAVGLCLHAHGITPHPLTPRLPIPAVRAGRVAHLGRGTTAGRSSLSSTRPPPPIRLFSKPSSSESERDAGAAAPTPRPAPPAPARQKRSCTLPPQDEAFRHLAAPKASPRALFLRQDSVQGLIEMRVEIGQRGLLPQRHQLVGAVEERDDRRRR
jgi:hypothetical protein